MSNPNLSLEYLVKPAISATEKTKAIFLFHGYGSNKEDLFSFANELPEDYCIISAQAPYTLEPYGFAWYAINFDAEKGKWTNDDQAIKSRDAIANFIDEACEAFNLDTNNVTIVGFSQGSILSFAVALTYPSKIKNVIALSGYIHPNIIDKKTDLKAYKHLNIFASHGQVDQVIPLAWAQQIPEYLNSCNIPVTFKEYPVGHGVNPQNFYDFKSWLANQH